MLELCELKIEIEQSIIIANMLVKASQRPKRLLCKKL